MKTYIATNQKMSDFSINISEPKTYEALINIIQSQKPVYMNTQKIQKKL